ncbi:MAG TPA: DUF4364 family protein [Eubacteriales bacterium]|nr:DUF4364 family protein [Clostridia bacterium]HRV72399.1 DUF4364 family protein [Eubacteriales bacterium]
MMFIHGDAKSKLLIMYFIRSAGGDIRPDVLCNAMIKCGSIDYFSFQLVSGQLEQDGYVAIVPRSFGQSYNLTSIGDEALKLFINQVPFSERDRIDKFVQDNKLDMLRETQYSSDMEQMRDGGWLVTLRVSELNAVMIEIKLQVATQELALTMRSNWQAQSADIYLDVWERLSAGKR